MVTKDQVQKVVDAANVAITAAQAVGSAEVAKETSDASLALAQSDNLSKQSDLVASEKTFTDSKVALDAAVAELNAAF